MSLIDDLMATPFHPEYVEARRNMIARAMAVVALGRNHVEYWKTIRRGGNGPEGHTVGFEWFATWRSTRRLRWPIGRRGPSVLGWIATSTQCRRELAEERAEALDRPPIARNMRRAFMGQFELMRIVLGVKYNGNPRQGWAPSGEALT